MMQGTRHAGSWAIFWLSVFTESCAISAALLALGTVGDLGQRQHPCFATHPMLLRKRRRQQREVSAGIQTRH